MEKYLTGVQSQGQLVSSLPYFLDLGRDAQERDLERGLTTHIREFLLELGVGFAFVGSQYHLEVGGQDYYIDLLFYHIKLHCYVAFLGGEGIFRIPA